MRPEKIDLVLLGRPALANPHWPVWAARELGTHGLSPVNYEIREAETKPKAAQEILHDCRGTTLCRQ